MMLKANKRPLFAREEEMHSFAHSYLSEGFPNANRNGCPPDDALQVFAKRPANKSVGWISDHLTSCSPCFNSYMGHLAIERSKAIQNKIVWWITRSLVTAAAALMIMIGIYISSSRWHTAPRITPGMPQVDRSVIHTQASKPPTYIAASIDLGNAVPIRGVRKEVGGSSLPQVIPLNPLVELIVQLPLGSEKREYSVTLSSKRHIVWSGSAQAHQENGQMLVHMHADLGHVSAGKYQMTVISKGFRITLPIIVKAIV